MTTDRVPRLGRFAAALVALFGLVVLMPVTLAWVSRARFGAASPVTGIEAPWRWRMGAIIEALRDRLTDDAVVDVVIRTCLIVAWVAIAATVTTTLVETVHVLRHRGVSSPTVRGLGWAQSVGRFIAAGLLVVVPMTSPRASLATLRGSAAGAAETPLASVVDEGRAHPGDHDIGRIDRIASARAPTTHVIAPGESIYSIAQVLARHQPTMTGAEIADAILDANLGREMAAGRRFTNPAYTEVGWRLLIPGEIGPGDPGATHRVVDGDTLWDIADRYYGDPMHWSAIWHANRGMELSPGRVFEDPDLILPGWRLRLPPLDADATDPAPADTEPAEPGPAEPEPVDDPATDDPATDRAAADQHTTARTDDESVTTAPLSTPPTGTAALPPPASVPQPDPTPESSPSITPASAGPLPPPAGDASTTTAPITTAPSSSGDPPSVADDVPGPAPTLRIEHAAAVAAGMLALLGVRRRRRLRGVRRRARLPVPSTAAVTTERALRAVDAGERTMRTDVAVRAVAAELLDTPARIGMLVVGGDGTIAVTLTDPAELPAPWLATDTPRRWTLPGSVPVEQLAERSRIVGAPCVALVQLGTSAGRDVLVDLEACPLLVVEAAHDRAGAVISGVAAGLASAPHAETAHLIGIGLPDSALLDHRNAHRADSLEIAIDLAASLVGPLATSERSSFSLRSRHTGGEAWEPAVVLSAAVHPAELDRVLPTVPPAGHGLAIVAAVPPGSATSAPARLVEGSTGWSLTAFDSVLSIIPVGVTDDELRTLVELLDGVDGSTAADDDPTELPVDHACSTQAPAEEPSADHAIVVRVMGGVDVVDRHGTAGVFERSKSVELIAWLATHRDKSTRSAARTAMWDLDVRDATFANVVSEARRALARLVDPPDGEEWLGRTLTEQLPLHPAVVTDAELIERRLEASRGHPSERAIEILRPAVEMVRDMPFAGAGYLWPDAEGITSNLVVLATAVAAELAEHALALGNTELVFWATGRGLLAIPGHEELIGMRMQAHARAGDLSGVRQEWACYERVIAADVWSDGEPAPKLLELRRALLTSHANADLWTD